MISTRDAIDLMWQDMGEIHPTAFRRRPADPDEDDRYSGPMNLWSRRDGEAPVEAYADPVILQAFTDMILICPRWAYVFLYEPDSGLDTYVRAWFAALDDMPVRWALALALRFGLTTGRQEPWAEIARRTGVTVPTVREHAAKGLAWLRMNFNGQGGENMHKVRAVAQDYLKQPGHGGEPGIASNAATEDEGFWQPTYARQCRTWYTPAEMAARLREGLV